MGKPMHLKNACLCTEECIEREPCEVKHLSNTWKINQERKLGDSLSSGERTGIDKEYKIVSSQLTLVAAVLYSFGPNSLCV